MGLGQGPRICVPNMFPSSAVAAGLGPHFENLSDLQVFVIPSEITQAGDTSWHYLSQKRKRRKCSEKKGGDKETQTGTDLRDKSSACWALVPRALWD